MCVCACVGGHAYLYVFEREEGCVGGVHVCVCVCFCVRMYVSVMTCTSVYTAFCLCEHN